MDFLARAGRYSLHLDSDRSAEIGGRVFDSGWIGDSGRIAVGIRRDARL
jgi:hypothetical protein